MLCQKCQKNQANVHMMQNINGVVTEEHLCTECANLNQSEFSGFSQKMFGNIFSDSFFGNDFFRRLFGGQNSMLAIPSMAGEDLKVREYDEYALPEYNKAYQNNNNEDREMPNAKKILALKKDLKTAVKKEDFEKAAKIRDRIKELER